jgi:phosphoenolpyruvate synthase/pyruvate phosphate dikinase
MTDLALTQPLIDARELATAGGKGANLGALLRAGFPVPDGFVVTTAAYDRFVADNGLAERIVSLAGDPGAIGELFVGGTVPGEVSQAITAAYADLGAGAVAVRSSATAEDLPGASFAGQQETFLNVTGSEAVLAAVRRCWASLWTERAMAYRAARASEGPLSIAVVIQHMVPAAVSGVLFTANPGNGRDEAVITAAWGLGESVVGGTVDPDTYVVRRDSSVRVTVGAKARMTVTTASGSAEVATPPERRNQVTLTEEQARELAHLGREVAAHFGVPQDIEWVQHEGVFRLVQARPITALPEPVGEVPTQWPIPRKGLYFRASIVEQMPDPLTPLFADSVRIAVPESLAGLFRDLGARVGRLDVDFPTINGYAFYMYSPEAFRQAMLFAPVGFRLLFGKGAVVMVRSSRGSMGSRRCWARARRPGASAQETR